MTTGLVSLRKLLEVLSRTCSTDCRIASIAGEAS